VAASAATATGVDAAMRAASSRMVESSNSHSGGTASAKRRSTV
jgi:hypothetical protein